MKVGIDREHVGGWCIDLNVSSLYLDLKVGIDRILLLWYIFCFWRYMEVGLGFFGGLMGWDVRRAKRDLIGWRLGVGGVMMFVVVFVVVFAPEWKRGEWRKRREEKGRGGRRKRREGKGRGGERLGEGIREEEGRQKKRRGEKRRQERLHLYIRKGV